MPFCDWIQEARKYLNRVGKRSDDRPLLCLSLSDYSIGSPHYPFGSGDCIGAGGNGIVYVDRNRKTGDKGAVKELKNIENAESIRKISGSETLSLRLPPRLHLHSQSPSSFETLHDVQLAGSEPATTVRHSDQLHSSSLYRHQLPSDTPSQEQEVEQYIGCTQREICDPPIGDGGSASVHVASSRVTRDLNAVKKEDAAAANSISESTNFSKWEKGETIGAGGFGTVYVARNRETGALCAVKELKDIHELENIKSIQKEIEILSQLEHTNVVKYYGHEIVGRHISLYMEYIQPGSLTKYIPKQRGLPEPLIRNFTRQILFGLVYLHSKRVVHRDIKPDNLLIDSNDIVKLGDFGVAKHLEESMGNHSMLGTLYYAAPEVLDKTMEYQSSCDAYAPDIWGLGCVIIQMVSGDHPWPGLNPVQAAFKVVQKQCPPIPGKLCQEGKNFLKFCFKRNPANRPSASALLCHPFVKAQTTSLADGRKYN